MERFATDFNIEKHSNLEYPLDYFSLTYKLNEMIARIIEQEGGLFLDLAAYSIVMEKNAGQYYQDYAYNHALFTDDMKAYSDSTISDFLHNVTIDQQIQFLNEWNTKREYSQRIYISYDSTNKRGGFGLLIPRSRQ